MARPDSRRWPPRAGPRPEEEGIKLKARIKYSGINTCENARRLSEMITKAQPSLQEDKDRGKAGFIEAVEKQESQFSAQGLNQA